MEQERLHPGLAKPTPQPPLLVPFDLEATDGASIQSRLWLRGTFVGYAGNELDSSKTIMFMWRRRLGTFADSRRIDYSQQYASFRLEVCKASDLSMVWPEIIPMEPAVTLQTPVSCVRAGNLFGPGEFLWRVTGFNDETSFPGPWYELHLK